MRVLGIDPGSETTGWGVVEGDRDGRKYRLIEFGALKLKSSASFSSRLLKISRGLEEIISRLKPDACAIEDAFYANNPKVILKLGQVRGVALLAAESAALEISEYSPRLIKQTVAGYGNAEKQQVQEMVRVLLSLTAIPEPHAAARFARSVLGARAFGPLFCVCSMFARSRAWQVCRLRNPA